MKIIQQEILGIDKTEEKTPNHDQPEEEKAGEKSLKLL